MLSTRPDRARRAPGGGRSGTRRSRRARRQAYAGPAQRRAIGNGALWLDNKHSLEALERTLVLLKLVVELATSKLERCRVGDCAERLLEVIERVISQIGIAKESRLQQTRIEIARNRSGGQRQHR